MTTKTSGCIIYYSADGGAISRTVTAADVEAMEAELTALKDSIELGVAWAHGLRGLVSLWFAQYQKADVEREAIKQAYAVAAAIMRSQPVGIAPRLVQAWRAVVEKVEAVAK